jgi:hypothetical protein
MTVQRLSSLLGAPPGRRPAERERAVLVLHAEEKDVESQIELYLDGQKIAEGKVPVIGAHAGDVNLGRCGNTLFHDRKAVELPGHYFAGRIDDFRIANRSLTAEDVRALAKQR